MRYYFYSTYIHTQLWIVFFVILKISSKFFDIPADLFVSLYSIKIKRFMVLEKSLHFIFGSCYLLGILWHYEKYFVIHSSLM